MSLKLSAFLILVFLALSELIAEFLLGNSEAYQKDWTVQICCLLMAMVFFRQIERLFEDYKSRKAAKIEAPNAELPEKTRGQEEGKELFELLVPKDWGARLMFVAAGALILFS